jgi:hypothetical protein
MIKLSLKKSKSDISWATKKQSNSNSDVKYTTIQFHGNSYIPNSTVGSS